MEIYPMAGFSTALDCAPEAVLLYVLASKEHFALLVPMNDVQVSPFPGSTDPNEPLFEELVDQFPELALGYIELAEEHDCPLPLPDCDRIGMEFSGEFCELVGNMTIMKDDEGPVPEEFIISGVYFFIAETGIAIEEFLGTNKATLQ